MDSGRGKILVVEDEPDIRELIRYNLEQVGFEVFECEDGEGVLERVEEHRPDLVILDLMLPKADGLDLCKMLRQRPRSAHLPIVLLTAKAAEVDKVLGLELGADDYITKPFSPRELVARVKAVLRRSESRENSGGRDTFESGRLRMDFESREVWVEGVALEMSLREFELLGFFVKNPMRVYDRLTILDSVWGDDTYVEPRTIDVHIRRLRMLIERDASQPKLLQTVRGVGYRFNADALADA